jgi:hypothetical protein
LATRAPCTCGPPMTDGATATTAPTPSSISNPVEGNANPVDATITKGGEKTVAEGALTPRIQQVVDVIAEARARRIRAAANPVVDR